MIEINLLPQEAKTKTRLIGKIKIDSKYFLYLIPSVFALLILVHLCLAGFSVFKSLQSRALNARWDKLKPQREALSALKKEYDVQAFNAMLAQELSLRSLNWSEKLNRLSMNLPSGIWFNEILVSKNDFILKASVISLQKTEMSLINRFIDTLKKDASFRNGMDKLEVGSMQKKPVGGYDVVDFILTAKIKSR